MSRAPHVAKLYQLKDLFPHLAWDIINQGTVETSRGKIQALEVVGSDYSKILFQATTIIREEQYNEPQPIAITIPEKIHIGPYDDDSWTGIVSVLKTSLEK